ncbi:MAG: SPOR domain-containing protein [Xanthomonadales bacterium]|nr:SPOR domain-containing protein [Xanthomonadales bacterium]
MRTAAIPAIFCFLLALVPATQADDYARGLEAFTDERYNEAMRLWIPMAEEGDTRAQFRLGSMYHDGIGVDRNYYLSSYWFEQAATRGVSSAQFNLGNAYKHGHGVPQDEREASYWWRLAADQDLAPAQLNLANQYATGLGVPKDPDQAQYWYERAAANGNAQAQHLLRTQERAGELQAMADSSRQQQTEGAADETHRNPSPVEAALAAINTSLPAPKPIVSAPPAKAAAVATPVPQGATGPAVTADSAASSSMRGASWLMQQDPDHFTLQLIAVSKPESLERYVDQHRLREPADGVAQDLGYFSFQRDGRDLYVLVLGVFADRASAQAWRSQLPESVLSNSPWIRRVGDLHQIMTPADRRLSAVDSR